MAQPQVFSPSVPGHCLGRRVVGVPVICQPGVVGHRLAQTEVAAVARTERAHKFASAGCQMVWGDLPLMLPPASVLTARAAQPDSLLACVCEVPGLLPPIEGGVPPGVKGEVVGVCQGLFALVIEAWLCRGT